MLYEVITVAGSARLMEAFVIAAALSLGAAFGLLVFPVGGAYAAATGFHESLGLSFLLSALAAGSFAYFFHISKYDIVITSYSIHYTKLYEIFRLAVLPGTALFERRAELALDSEAKPPYAVRSTPKFPAPDP